VTEGLGDVKKRLDSMRKSQYVMLVILLFYIFTSGNDSAASAVYLLILARLLSSWLRSGR
jgi:hypothetical protein